MNISVILVMIIFFAIPTTIFAFLEPSWGALDAFYYCFISLTTIGLGDYIPGDGVSAENHSLYKICITCYLIFGKCPFSYNYAYNSLIIFFMFDLRPHCHDACADNILRYTPT